VNTPSATQLARAVRVLRRGLVLAYPTEGVWGLGCDPSNEAAVRRLLDLKGRSASKGLILIAASVDQVRHLLRGLSPAQLQPILATWPGPLTWLVPAPPGFPAWITGGKPSLAVRVSAHTGVVALCKAFGGPLVSTSANPSGRAAARSELAVRRYFRERLDGLLPGELGGQQGPSEIRDALTGRIIRPASPAIIAPATPVEALGP
jgi:L-threonylcarbamoyladenylate synthase